MLTKRLKFSLIITVIVIGLVGLGGIIGYGVAVQPIRMEIISYSRGETLGGVLKALLKYEEKENFAKTYYDGTKLMKEMDNFSWAVPNVPTPFVGTGPRPGKNNNAYINSMQFRAEKELEIPKPPNIFRIFITGGSTAFGSGAPSQDKTIAGYLSEMLNRQLASSLKYEVFTAANPAWASTHERIIIENRLSELEPDIILSFSGNNEVHWGLLGRDVLWFRTYADEFFWNLINTAYKTAWHPPMPEVVTVSTDPVPPHLVAARLTKNVRVSSYVLSLKGIRYLFFLQPTLSVTKKILTERERSFLHEKDYFVKCYDEIDSRLKSLKMDNFYFINLSSVFDNVSGNEDIFIDSYHFGDKGNELVARNIFAHLKQIIDR
jgi:hypothetical protein